MPTTWATTVSNLGICCNIWKKSRHIYIRIFQHVLYMYSLHLDLQTEIFIKYRKPTHSRYCLNHVTKPVPSLCKERFGFNGYFTSCSPLRYSWHKQSNTVLFSSKSSFRGKHCRTDGKTWNIKSKTYNANMYTKTHKGLLLIQYRQFCYICIKLINALDLMTRFGKYMDLIFVLNGTVIFNN